MRLKNPVIAAQIDSAGRKPVNKAPVKDVPGGVNPYAGNTPSRRTNSSTSM